MALLRLSDMGPLLLRLMRDSLLIIMFIFGSALVCNTSFIVFMPSIYLLVTIDEFHSDYVLSLLFS